MKFKVGDYCMINYSAEINQGTVLRDLPYEYGQLLEITEVSGLSSYFPEGAITCKVVDLPDVLPLIAWDARRFELAFRWTEDLLAKEVVDDAILTGTGYQDANGRIDPKDILKEAPGDPSKATQPGAYYLIDEDDEVYASVWSNSPDGAIEHLLSNGTFLRANVDYRLTAEVGIVRFTQPEMRLQYKLTKS